MLSLILLFRALHDYYYYSRSMKTKETHEHIFNSDEKASAVSSCFPYLFRRFFIAEFHRPSLRRRRRRRRLDRQRSSLNEGASDCSPY